MKQLSSSTGLIESPKLIILTTSITCEGRLDVLPPGSAQREDFVSGLVEGLAASLALPLSHVSVTALREGSVIADVSLKVKAHLAYDTDLRLHNVLCDPTSAFNARLPGRNPKASPLVENLSPGAPPEVIKESASVPPTPAIRSAFISLVSTSHAHSTCGSKTGGVGEEMCPASQLSQGTIGQLGNSIPKLQTTNATTVANCFNQNLTSSSNSQDSLPPFDSENDETEAGVGGIFSVVTRYPSPVTSHGSTKTSRKWTSRGLLSPSSSPSRCAVLSQGENNEYYVTGRSSYQRGVVLSGGLLVAGEVLDFDSWFSLNYLTLNRFQTPSDLDRTTSRPLSLLLLVEAETSSHQTTLNDGR
jgi:hypothetical protein